jgi:hypothetical protein
MGFNIERFKNYPLWQHTQAVSALDAGNLFATGKGSGAKSRQLTFV